MDCLAMFVVARQLSGAGGEKLNQLTYVQLPFHLCKHFPPSGIAAAQIDRNDLNRPTQSFSGTTTF